MTLIQQWFIQREIVDKAFAALDLNKQYQVEGACAYVGRSYCRNKEEEVQCQVDQAKAHRRARYCYEYYLALEEQYQ